MKKISILILLVILIVPVFAQITGNVYSLKTKKPLENVNVIAISDSKKGGSTDKEGGFSIDASNCKYLYLSSIGYNDTIVQLVNGSSNTIYLSPQIYKLEEVLVLSKRVGKKITIGQKSEKLSKMLAFVSSNPYIKSGVYYKPSPRNVNKSILKIKLYVSPEGKLNCPMGLRLRYYTSTDKMKYNYMLKSKDFNDLLPELIVFEANKTGWIEISLSEYDVRIPEGGFFVFVNTLSYEEKYKWNASYFDEPCYGTAFSCSAERFNDYKFTHNNQQNNFYSVIANRGLYEYKPLMHIEIR